MTNHVEGKSIIITGAGGGFGKLVSEKAAALGAKVTCADIDGDAAEAVAAAIRADGGVARALLPLRFKSTQLVDMLRHQPDMRHDRYAPLCQEADCRRHGLTAFELHAGATGFGENATRRVKGLLRRCLIAAKGHVDDDDAVETAPHNRGAMGAHHVQRHRQGRQQRQRVTLIQPP